MDSIDSAVIRCGDVEIDLALEQIRRAGVPQHLRQKSLRVLAYLIEHRSRVISKRELLEAVWNDVAVTDDTLVQSIVEIRKVLGDDSREARFVRTIPRAGYRFVAPLDSTDPELDSATGLAGASAPKTGPEPVPDPAAAAPPPRLVARPLSLRVSLAAAIAALIIIGAALGAALRREHGQPRSGDAGPMTVAILPFEKRSGGPELDWLRDALPEMLMTQLARSERLSVIDREQLARQAARRPRTSQRATLSEGLAIARARQADRLVTGTFAQLGGRIRVDVQLVDVSSGRILSGESVEGPSDELLRRIDGLSNALLARLEGPRSETTRLVDAMTDNLEAYKLYTTGVERAQSLNNPEAISLFEKALTLDPGFAMAHARIGYVYGVTWTLPARAKPHFERALQLGGRLGKKERLSIEIWRAISEGRYETATELLRTMIARYPTDTDAYQQAGNLLSAEERLAEAAEVLERGLLIDPGSPELHNALGAVYGFQRRKAEAVAEHERYVQLAPGEANARDSLGLTWQSFGEYERAMVEYRHALEIDPRFEIARIHLANTCFQLGRHREAIAHLEQYIASAPSDNERARGYAELAQLYRSRRDFPRATQSAQRAAILPAAGTYAMYFIALDRGDRKAAQALRPTLEVSQQGRGRRVTLRLEHYLRGYEALRNGRGEEAIALFQRALRYQPPVWALDPYDDCLANAYRELGQHVEAAREYERVLQSNPNHALARYRLGLTYEALLRPAQAREQYRKFLEIWKNADPDLAEVIDARRRLSNAPESSHVTM